MNMHDTSKLYEEYDFHWPHVSPRQLQVPPSKISYCMFSKKRCLREMTATLRLKNPSTGGISKVAENC